jgi:ABC-type nitrate/sulfonate/bicarbonate transport system permease component
MVGAYPNLEVELVALPRNYSLGMREVDIAITMDRPDTGDIRLKKLTSYALGIYGTPAYFKDDDSLKITVVAMACFFPVFINTLAGVEGIDDVLLQTARTFRTGRIRTLTRVFLPATLPMIAAGLRIAIGIGLVVTVIPEMIAGSSGLGYYIVQMQYAMKPEAMYAAIATLALTGYALNRIFLVLEAYLVPWIGKD